MFIQKFNKIEKFNALGQGVPKGGDFINLGGNVIPSNKNI